MLKAVAIPGYQAKIAKLKDGRPHLAYKPEHAVDLDTGIIVAAVLHPADQGDTTTIEGTLTVAEKNLAQISPDISLRSVHRGSERGIIASATKAYPVAEEIPDVDRV